MGLIVVDEIVGIGEDWIGLTEAAAKLGRPEASVKRLAEAGRIRTGKSERGMKLYSSQDVRGLVAVTAPSKRY